MIEATTKSKDEGSEQIKSFVQGQVDSLLKHTHVQAESDAQQAAQEQAESEYARDGNVRSEDKHDQDAPLNR